MSLKDDVKAKEAKAPVKAKKSIVAELTEEVKEPKKNWSDFEKNMMISAYMDIDKYLKFKKINEKRGVTNNGTLNTFVADYVLMHEAILNEDDLAAIAEEKKRIVKKAKEKSKKKEV